MKPLYRLYSTLTLLLALMFLPAAAVGQVDLTTDDAEIAYNDAIFNQGSGGVSSGTGIFDPFYRIKGNAGEAVQGVNTDAKNVSCQFDTECNAQWTTSLLLSTVTQVYVEETLYREFFLDINQVKNAPAPYELRKIEIFTDDQPDLNCYSPGSPAGTYLGTCDDGAPASLDWWLDSAGDTKVLLKYDLEAGSGNRDMRLLVKDSDFSVPDGQNCNYGQPGCDTYVYLYSEFYPNDDGFEEWSTAVQPFVVISKTAEGSLDETTDWTIEKTVSPDAWDLFTGDTGTSEYTVTVDKTVTTGNEEVTGVITLSVPDTLPDGDENAISAEVDGLTDVFAGIPATSITCTAGALPFTLDPGDTTTCDYVVDPGGYVTGTNTATAMVLDREGNPVPFVATATVGSYSVNSVGEPGTINVSDTNGESWSASDDASWKYSRTFTCDGDEGTHDNVASIDETSDSDDATVTVSCNDIAVSKTADGAQKQNYNWTIEKVADPASWAIFAGDQATSSYSIVATRTLGDLSDFSVAGDIWVTNNHGTKDAVIASLSDVIEGVDPGDVTVENCDVDGEPVPGFPATIPGGETLQCKYSAPLPNGESGRTNTATANLQNYDYDYQVNPTAGGTTSFQGTADVVFGTPEVGLDASATADDSAIAEDWGFGPESDDCEEDGDDLVCEVTYERTFGPYAVGDACGPDIEIDNTVVITGDDTEADLDESSATVTIDCYELIVTKDAETSLTREWNWQIDKGAFYGGVPLTAPLVGLVPGETIDVAWEVEVDLAGDPVDSDWAVEGTIAISNPAPIDAELADVSDVVSPAIGATFNCGGGFPLVVPAEDVIYCGYSADLPDGEDRTNTATASLNNYNYPVEAEEAPIGTTDFSGSADVLFDEDTVVSKVDECVSVTDNNAAAWDEYPALETGDTVCADDAPKTYAYGESILITTEDCDGIVIENTATYIDLEPYGAVVETGSASAIVLGEVSCQEGCTLTQGYWKTHNPSFKGGASKKSDSTWEIVQPSAETSEFFLSGASWFDVFWTAPKGNAYFNLAHQWMAAYLNCNNVDDARTPDCSIIEDELDRGMELFQVCEPRDVSKKDPDCDKAEFLSLASTLGLFNEGELPGGPPHCDGLEYQGIQLDLRVQGSVDAALELEARLEVGSVVAEDEGTTASAASAAEGEATAVELPDEFAVGNYPNPFNPTTTIQVALPEASHVRVAVYDVLGRMVITLVEGQLSAGTHSVTFDAGSLPSGVYLYRFEYDGGAVTKTMQLLK